MKKVAVDLTLGRKTKTRFRRTGQKSLLVAATMPTGDAVRSSNYGLRFGKIGIMAAEICEKFNVPV
jgi:hypothetical protein